MSYKIMVYQECQISDTDYVLEETDTQVESLFGNDLGIRSSILLAPELMVGMNEDKTMGGNYIEKFCCIIWYGSTIHKGWGKRKIMVKNENELLDKWEKLIVGLATSHSKDDRDQHEHDIDDALTPILSAPVKQIREMFRQLVERLKNNDKVPFYAWRSIEMWYEKVVLPAKAEGIIMLKRKLAGEIAEMVEEDVKADISEAIMGALMWRDEKELIAMKNIITEDKQTDTPAKAKIERKTVGRQSCIFLKVSGSKGKKTIML